MDYRFILSLMALPLCAQTPPTRPAPVISPEAKVAHSMTFRLKAPAAKEVSVQLQGVKDALPMVKADDGIWSATVNPIAAGVWEYSFRVDGVTMIDPGNPAIKPTREPRTSILQLASTPPAIWDFQKVPHGTGHQLGYFSEALNAPREIRVYTPPGYETSSGKFPLLVLQHGSGDNQNTWVEHGKAHWILDNLIATGKAKPMIIVMLDGHPPEHLNASGPEKRATAIEAFRRELLEDALPLVEKSYRVEDSSSQRAIAGLSMSGAQALSVGLGNLDRFAWVGSLSGSRASETVVQAICADASGTNAKLRLLWIGCGKEDFLLESNQEFTAKLKESGINHQWHLTAGDHSWPVWREYLAELLPLLFQPSVK